MKHTHLFAFALAAAITAVPAFAQQQDQDNKAPAEKHEKAKPADNRGTENRPAAHENKSQEQHRTDANDSRDSKIPQSDHEPGVRNPEAARQQGDRHDANRMPQSDQEPAARQTDDRRENRDANRGGDRASQHAEYHFRGDEKSRLRTRYRNINTVNRGRRVTIVREQVMPVEIRTEIEPVPADVVSYLPPPPPGYQFGFVDGYCVVYDPTTFLIIDVIDLLS